MFWSALACGLTLGITLIARGVLQHHLPNAPWERLVTSLGYAAGFIAVELGRQELYTGNTLTAVLPLLHRRRPVIARNVLRVWSVVLIGNLAGAAIFAIAAAWTTAFEAPLRGAFDELARHAVSHSSSSAFVKAIFGGWLIALMIWLMPGAHHARIWVVVMVAWVLAASNLTHVVVGSVDALFGIFSGAVSFQTYAVQYFVPVLAGNTIGGLVFVAALNHLQIAADEAVDDKRDGRVVAP